MRLVAVVERVCDQMILPEINSYEIDYNDDS